MYGKKLTQLGDDDVRYAIENKEFSAEFSAAAPRVAIIVTQSWCHQWHDMLQWLRAPAANGNAGDVAIFYYEYDLTDLFDPFREFKEQVWQNAQIPYVRYYHDGSLVSESNYCSLEEFRTHFAL